MITANIRLPSQDALTQQNHAPQYPELTGGQAIDIEAARHIQPVVIPAIPADGVIAGLLNPIHKRSDLLPQ